MSMKLYECIKRRGFLDTILILGQNGEMEQKVFFDSLLQSEGYYNAYLRSKQHLLDNDIIMFKMNRDKKMISLTERGMNVYNKFKEIEDLLN